MPGKKQNNKHNYIAHKEWMENKKKGRPKQEWIFFAEPRHAEPRHRDILGLEIAIKEYWYKIGFDKRWETNEF